MDLKKNTVTGTGDERNSNDNPVYIGHPSQFIKIYGEMANNIRDEHFDEISKIVKSENVIFSIDSLRINFLECLTETVNKIHETRNLKQKLFKIQVLQERYKKKEPLKWHPHGKTAEEQTVSKRIRMLNEKKNFMIDLLKRQQVTLEARTTELEKNRKRFKELETNRAELTSILDMKIEQLKNFQDEFKQLRYKISR